jgi:predicted RNA-binding Zn-ribbon protein involved in translation (DUF1610 family)
MPNATVATPVEKERKFPCKSCGANLTFAPGQSVLKCTFCGHAETIPQTAQEIKEYSFNDYLQKPRSKGYGSAEGKYQDVRCNGCGAVAHLDATVSATTCPYCGSPMVLDDAKTEESDEDVITPEGLIPFKVTAQRAQQLFKEWIAGLWFAPNGLKNESHASQLHGVYHPYWTYDANTISHWTGERGDYYYTTETYTTEEDGKTVTRTREVRHTRWTFVSGVHSEFFDDVLIDAGKDLAFPATYNLGELVPYTSEYLSGLGAERYTLSCEDGWKEAKQEIAGEIRSAVNGEIGGDEQRVLSIDTAFSGITYKHILLPLWISCYRYANKSYCFQINGQSGAVAGSRPYSFWKIAALVLVIIAVIAGIVIAVQHGQHPHHMR